MIHLTRTRGCLAAIVALMLAGLAGCSWPDEEQVKPAVAVKQPDAVAPSKPVEAQPVSRKRLQKSFKEAVILDPPAGQQCMPVRTFAGKNVAGIFEAVAGAKFEGGLWDRVDFFDAQGRPIRYRAVVKTDLGEMHIDLLSDAAPHHVTNFIALARAGYYDGLVFERTIRVPTADEQTELIEAGCPLGTGEPGHGSIGYWLKPEFNNEAHIEGTVGACHAEEPDTAACKFYITLNKAPILDQHFTVFAKVTNGLDVARKIFTLPVRNDAAYPEGDRPEKPVVIRKVTIVTKDTEK